VQKDWILQVYPPLLFFFLAGKNPAKGTIERKKLQPLLLPTGTLKQAS